MVAPPPHGAAVRKPALPALTGLRSILAVNILFFHFTPTHLQYVAPFIENGFVFVGCFFLLSGFVLAYNYDERALTLNRRQFWLARMARLYPIYLLALVLFLPMLLAEWQAHSHAEFWLGLFLTPLLLQGWSPVLATFWNTVGWTLSCELLLYAAFPWVLRLWASRASAFDTPRRLAAAFVALWVLGMVPHMVYLVLNPDHLPTPVDRYSYGMWLRVLKYSPPAYMCMFLCGIVLGKLHLRLHLADRHRLALAAASLGLIVVLFYTAVPHVPYIILHGGLLLPLFAALTLGISGTNLVASAFAWHPLLAVGETTFCLYMLHFNAINLLHQWHIWERLHLAAWDPWVSYIAVLLLAAVAHHFVEQPARRLLLQRFSAPGKAAPPIPQPMLAP